MGSRIIEKVVICFPGAAASHLRRLEAPNSTRFFASGLLFSRKYLTLVALLLLYQVGVYNLYMGHPHFVFSYK